MQRTLDLSYDRLVIGSDLSAFAFSYVHECPAIYMRVLAPYKNDEQGTYESDKRLWNDMAYALSNSNLLPFSDKIVSLRLEENNILKAVTKFGVVATIKYNQLIISDDYKIEGLPPVSNKTSNANWVLDWFHVKHGTMHPYEEIFDYENTFVKKVVFYISKRVFEKQIKDCVSVSKLTDEELASGEYDENLARLKTLKMIKDAGIKGCWDKTNSRFLIPKLTSMKRDIYPLGKNLYNNLPENITILLDNADNILKLSKKNRWTIYGINR
jgi:hypothetical protein